VVRQIQHVVPLLFILLFLNVKIQASDTGREQELIRLYKTLIEDENRHDLSAVRKLVWNSTSTLFVAKAPTGWRGYWGIDDVMQHLHDLYQTPFQIDPDYDEEKVVFITPEIAETYAPVRITLAYAGQNPVPKPFIMVLLWVSTADGWKMASDIPIPVPPDPPHH
jgi:hypothetical protein